MSRKVSFMIAGDSLALERIISIKSITLDHVKHQLHRVRVLILEHNN